MRKRVTLAFFFTFGCVLLGLACANFFPDQTWRALSTARTMYDGIVSRLTPMPSGAARGVQESKIYESLVRDIIGSNPSNRKIFLSVENSDPSDDLISRFRASGLVVNKASEAHIDETKSFQTGYWIDQANGRRAVRINIGSIRWVFGNRVEVESGLSCGHLCGGGCIYQLVKSNRRWTIYGCHNRWMS